MTTAYPGAIDDFTNPTASDTLNSVTVPHATQHANANDAIEAIETVLGTNPEGEAETVSARIGALETTVDTPDTGLSAVVSALDTTVNAEDTGLVDRVDALETGLGLDPFGGDLALSINQITAAEADEVAAVDVDTESVVYFKFTVDGTEYAVPAYTITPAE